MKNPLKTALHTVATVLTILLITALSSACGEKEAPAAQTKETKKHAKHSEESPESHGKEADEHDEHDEKPEKAGNHDAEKAGHKEHGDKHDEHEEGEQTEGEHGEHEEAIKLTEEQLKNGGIELAKTGPVKIRSTLALFGLVAINTEKSENLSARFPGVIRSVTRQLGDQVKAGETLAIVESNESLSRYPIKTSINGIVTDKQATVGAQTGDNVLFVVSDLSNVWVELDVFPRDRAKVKVGQTVNIQSQSGLKADGKLIYLSTFANSANQTLRARVLLDNSTGQWAPGQFVNGDVTISEAPAAIAVRNEAIQTVEGKTVVFVQEGEGLQPRPIKPGRADFNFTEVLEGLTLGETYVAENSFVLKSELGKENMEDED
ncbi:MAG: HlyD family efflux transporter periplasmic adaptor subunit [Gammaproteobacteria bacterium]|nr:MAG: HlyD family efflux transporter periplasmic adaptor subunit [Gammaproteobacteria bacterium]